MILSASLAIASSVPGVSAASESIEVPAAGIAPWRSMEFPNIARTTSWQPFSHGDRRGVRADSSCGASAQVLSLDGIDLESTPILSWEWRVDDLAIETAATGPVEPDGSPDDERKRALDDFSARVYVLFPFVPERHSAFQRLRHELAQALFGNELPGFALSWVWSARAPVGSRWVGPRNGSTRTIVRRTGRARGWTRERVDVLAELIAWRGEYDVAPNALALLTDTDDACGSATAYYAYFEFSARASKAPSPPANPR